MYQKHVIGEIGEDKAVEYLIRNKYKIIKRNFRCKQGEIDIIAKDKNEIVFIEIKTRTGNQYGRPAEAVVKKKKDSIYRTAEFYVMINKLEKAYIRLDVIEVYFRYDNTYTINHIKQAFTKQ